jgi:Homing endonuclease associated repeat
MAKEQILTDEDLLYEIVRLTKELGKELTEADINACAAADSALYAQRWGSFAKARQEAYQLFGTPLVVTIYRQWLLEVQKTRPGLLDKS